jgi:hypothetical protein
MANSFSLFPPSSAQNPSRTFNVFIIADTDAGKPVTGLVEGDLCYVKDTDKVHVATSATTWVELGTGSAAATTAISPTLSKPGGLGKWSQTSKAPSSVRVYAWEHFA